MVHLENIEELKKVLDLQKIKYDDTMLNDVVEYAKKIYKDKQRHAGKTVLEHAIGVAMEVAMLKMDAASICAAILHEVPKSDECDYKYMTEKFGEEVVEIVKGAVKLSYLNYSNQDKLEVEKLRNMFMAIAKDIRVIIIKLADRLYNMRHIKELDEHTQKIKASETLHIYAPIAHRLGISQIKSELEDISFRILYEEDYYKIKNEIDEKKEEREQYIEDRIKEITETLEKNGVKATVYGRPKHFYSIYKKMKEKAYSVDDLYDLLAIRIIVDSIKDCYTSLGVVHEMYKPMPGRFKDYIAVPKTNMYQSLHTTVFGENGKPFEIQIRTWDMHKVADYGVAAHFLYKEKNSKLSETDRKIVWLRQTLELQKEISDTSENVENIKDMKVELFGEEVFVFTPKGEIKALPKDSTPVDYAYTIHQGIAEKMIGAKINGKMVPISTKLNNTDVVEIVTSANSKGPSRDWLKFVKTSSARNKIVSFLKKQGREANIQKGKELFERELKKQKIVKDELLKDDILEKALKRCNFNNLDDCYENIGFGSISQVKVIHRIIEEYEKYLRSKVSQDDLENINDSLKYKTSKKNNASDGIIVEGIKNCLVKFSKCCNPIPGDDIVGYITYGKGVSIHRADCVNLNNLDVQTRKIEVKWQDKVALNFVTDIRIKSNDRSEIVSDILKKLQELKVDIVSINARKTMDKECIVDLSINVDSSEKLQKVIKEIRKVDSVFEVKRAK